MMFSPETYINNQKDKTYWELIEEREVLLKKVKEFEQFGDNGEIIKSPSPEVVYQCNLLYLSKLFELIEKKYHEEHMEDNEQAKL